MVKQMVYKGDYYLKINVGVIGAIKHLAACGCFIPVDI